MTPRRFLVFVAFIFELAAAAGIGATGLGSIHLSLVAAGLAAYFFAELL